MAELFDRLKAAVFASARLRRAIRKMEQGRPDRGFPLLARLAQRGVVEAQFRVGRAYIDGAGVPVSRATAAIWLEKAATAGHREAQAVLAALYLTGQTGPGDPGFFAEAAFLGADFDKALAWGRRAADAGAPDAMALVGYILTSGPEAERVGRISRRPFDRDRDLPRVSKPLPR